MMRSTTAQVAILALFGVVMASCGGGGGDFSPSEAAKSAKEVDCASAQIAQTVEMKNTSFKPDTTRISPGDVVKWVNRDGFAHTVTNGTGGSAGTFDSGNISGSGGTYCLKFPKKGNVRY
ncbi:MAG: plastocyanin/azurin family copper-binding protein, partial [Bradymonadaceae bacterium]